MWSLQLTWKIWSINHLHLTGCMQEMDWETIVAGLLHDTVEDTEHVTFERIEDQFGPAVRRIVEGETKVSCALQKWHMCALSIIEIKLLMSWPGLQVSKLGKMQCQNADSLARDVKADDLRQMFLAMTEEVCSLPGCFCLIYTYALF